MRFMMNGLDYHHIGPTMGYRIFGTEDSNSKFIVKWALQVQLKK